MPKLPMSDSDSGVASLPSKVAVPAIFRSSSSTIAVVALPTTGTSSTTSTENPPSTGSPSPSVAVNVIASDSVFSSAPAGWSRLSRSVNV